MLIFPLAESAISCQGVAIPPSHYLILAPTSPYQVVSIERLEANDDVPRLLVLWISPPFIADMARFLQIPARLQHLLHGIPLLQGDQLSTTVRELGEASRRAFSRDDQENLFLEVVGEVLRLLRLRHQALMGLAKHKSNTIDDLLPRLLQARQLLEARYTHPWKNAEIAASVGLSEFHFARLFKTAFDITLRQHIIHLRLDAARRQLEDSASTVTEVAFGVGYGSLSSFIHAFTKRFGLSPAQYQQRMRLASSEK